MPRVLTPKTATLAHLLCQTKGTVGGLRVAQNPELSRDHSTIGDRRFNCNTESSELWGVIHAASQSSAISCSR
jgi:hypothetical protein